jgi:uncharacterized Rossmann fold enzyme
MIVEKAFMLHAHGDDIQTIKKKIRKIMFSDPKERDG